METGSTSGVITTMSIMDITSAVRSSSFVTTTAAGEDSTPDSVLMTTTLMTSTVNASLYTTGQQSDEGTLQTTIIAVSIAASVVCIITMVICVITCYHKRKSQNYHLRTSDIEMSDYDNQRGISEETFMRTSWPSLRMKPADSEKPRSNRRVDIRTYFDVVTTGNDEEYVEDQPEPSYEERARSFGKLFSSFTI